MTRLVALVSIVLGGDVDLNNWEFEARKPKHETKPKFY
jgi:hypothetical protein